MRLSLRSWVVIALTSVLLAGCQATDSIEEPEPELITEETTENTSVLSLELGSCVNDADTPLSADLIEVPTVSCDEPHDSELYAIVSVDDGEYPGVDDLVTQGQTQCQALFTDFVGIDFRSSLLDFHFYYPTPSSWVHGDRSIYCMVSDPGLTVAGTLQDARR
jgi:hypothetical protein